MKIIPVAPQIPELKFESLDQYLDQNKIHLEKLTTIERNEVSLQLLRIRFDQALKDTREGSPNAQVWQNIQTAYARIIEAEKSNPDFANSLNAFLHYICTEVLSSADLEMEFIDLIIDAVEDWKEFCQRYNIVYVNNEVLSATAREFAENMSEDLLGEQGSKKYKLLNFGYAAAILASTILGNFTAGTEPVENILGIAHTTAEISQHTGFIRNLIYRISRAGARLCQKLTTGLGVPKQVSLQEFEQERGQIMSELKQGYDFMEAEKYGQAEECFKKAFKLARQLNKKRIIG